MNRLMRLSSLHYLLTLWMLVRVPASAAELPTSTPEAEGMSAEKLAKVGEIMNGFVKDKKIAGGIVLDRPQRQGGVPGNVRPAGSGRQAAGRARHDLSHLLDVEGHHIRGGIDARRRGEARP